MKRRPPRSTRTVSLSPYTPPFSSVYFRQAEALLTRSETGLAGLRLTKAQSDNFLAVPLGGTVPVGGAAPLTLADQQNGTVIAAGLPSELLVARPDILAAEGRLRAACANNGAARRSEQQWSGRQSLRRTSSGSHRLKKKMNSIL